MKRREKKTQNIPHISGTHLTSTVNAKDLVKKMLPLLTPDSLEFCDMKLKACYSKG